jgi:hypothetical protein
MNSQAPFKQLIPRAVLRNVSPMVIRAMAVPDYLTSMPCSARVLNGDRLGFRFPVHGQEFSSFHRATVRHVRTRYGDCQRRPRETFLYTCGAIDLWEGEFRPLKQPPGADSEDVPLGIGGRGATPPEPCGGPTADRLLRKRQQEG